mgnify:CR=1 FL=1
MRIQDISEYAFRSMFLSPCFLPPHAAIRKERGALSDIAGERWPDMLASAVLRGHLLVEEFVPGSHSGQRLNDVPSVTMAGVSPRLIKLSMWQP